MTLMGASTTPAQAQFTDCTHPPVSQVFAEIGDKALYALAPGGYFDDATSAGWSFSNGATVVRAMQADGSTGAVLDLGSDGVATSPPLCITSDYPTARLRSRNLIGKDKVSFAVSYLRDGVWTKPKRTGTFQGAKEKEKGKGRGGWALSKRLSLKPAKGPGWQQIRVSFIGGGKESRFQVDDFWIDPRASR